MLRLVVCAFLGGWSLFMLAACVTDDTSRQRTIDQVFVLLNEEAPRRREQGDRPGQIAALRQARSLALKAGDQSIVAAVDHSLAIALAEAGQVDEAVTVASRHRSQTGASDSIARGQVEATLTLALAKRGDVDRTRYWGELAMSALEASIAVERANGYYSPPPYHLMILAQALAGIRDFQPALAAVRRYVELSPEIPNPSETWAQAITVAALADRIDLAHTYRSEQSLDARIAAETPPPEWTDSDGYAADRARYLGILARKLSASRFPARAEWASQMHATHLKNVPRAYLARAGAASAPPRASAATSAPTGTAFASARPATQPQSRAQNEAGAARAGNSARDPAASASCTPAGRQAMDRRLAEIMNTSARNPSDSCLFARSALEVTQLQIAYFDRCPANPDENPQTIRDSLPDMQRQHAGFCRR